MPVHRYGLSARHDRDDLVEIIANELIADRDPHKRVRYKTPDAAPQIFIQENPHTDRMQVTVIWPVWKDVPEIQRPAIILDAFDEAKMKKDRERITVAMGLTPEEADVLGIASK